MRTFDGLLDAFESLEEHQKIWFLMALWTKYPHKYSYVTSAGNLLDRGDTHGENEAPH